MTSRPRLDGLQLAIFDKDGTLIDFHAMWGGWMRDFATRLEATAHLPLTNSLFRSFGFDPASNHVLPNGRLAYTPMRKLRDLAGEVLHEAGCPPEQIEPALLAAWFVPDPVATAKPLADLPELFGHLRARGMKIAIVTTDDRDPTQRTLEAFGVAAMVDTMACADDGVPAKPAPDSVHAICERLYIAPQVALVVGDTMPDMTMGKSAGAGLVVGVTSGISTAEMLGEIADVVIESVGDLL